MESIGNSIALSDVARKSHERKCLWSGTSAPASAATNYRAWTFTSLRLSMDDLQIDKCIERSTHDARILNQHEPHVSWADKAYLTGSPSDL